MHSQERFIFVGSSVKNSEDVRQVRSDMMREVLRKKATNERRDRITWTKPNWNTLGFSEDEDYSTDGFDTKGKLRRRTQFSSRSHARTKTKDAEDRPPRKDRRRDDHRGHLSVLKQDQDKSSRSTTLSSSGGVFIDFWLNEERGNEMHLPFAQTMTGPSRGRDWRHVSPSDQDGMQSFGIISLPQDPRQVFPLHLNQAEERVFHHWLNLPEIPYTFPTTNAPIHHKIMFPNHCRTPVSSYLLLAASSQHLNRLLGQSTSSPVTQKWTGRIITRVNELISHPSTAGIDEVLIGINSMAMLWSATEGEEDVFVMHAMAFNQVLRVRGGPRSLRHDRDLEIGELGIHLFYVHKAVEALGERTVDRFGFASCREADIQDFIADTRRLVDMLKYIFDTSVSSDSASRSLQSRIFGPGSQLHRLLSASPGSLLKPPVPRRRILHERTHQSFAICYLVLVISEFQPRYHSPSSSEDTSLDPHLYNDESSDIWTSLLEESHQPQLHTPTSPPLTKCLASLNFALESHFQSSCSSNAKITMPLVWTLMTTFDDDVGRERMWKALGLMKVILRLDEKVRRRVLGAMITWLGAEDVRLGVEGNTEVGSEEEVGDKDWETEYGLKREMIAEVERTAVKGLV